jgi:hypothetical protein
MATSVSDLGKALGKPVAGLGERSAEDESYDAAMQRIQLLLAQRENKPYNPTLLAIAQGMLAPSATGSFGEGLSAAAGNVLKSQEQEQKQNMENAQMRLQLAQAQKAQAQKQNAMKFLRGDQPPDQAGQPAGQGDASGPAVKTSQGMMTPRQISIISVANPELGEILDKEYKRIVEGFKTQPGGYVNVGAPGGPQYTPFGGKPMVERFIPGDPSINRQAMKVPMPEEAAIKLDKALQDRDAKTYYEIVDQFTTPMARPGAPTAAPGAPNAGGVPRPVARTPQELERQNELQAAKDKELATKLAGSEADRTNAAMNAGKASRALEPIYARSEKILQTPGIEKAMGVLARGDFTSAIGALLTESLQVGQYRVGIPAIKKILTDAGVDQNILDAMAELAQLEAISQFQQRQGLGAGTSVSNFEQMMVNQMGPTSDNTKEAYLKKLAFMKEKARFDVDLARELRRRKMTYDEFEDTRPFESMFRNYQNRVTGIVYPESGKVRPPTGGAPAPSSAGANIRERLGLPPKRD